jgi:3-oxoacyl-[acyl-carrier protein] reductase
MASLTGKTAIITGTSKGIGKATALTLAKQGANVAINYSSDDVSANELVKNITASSPEANPPRAIAVRADAGDVEQLENMVEEVVKLLTS